MDIGNWITLAAVIVALVLGVSSLIQTQMLQKRERREKLLNEIIEWVDGVHKAIWMVNREKIENDIDSIFDNLLFLQGRSIVVMEVARKVKLVLGVEISDAALLLSGFLKHLQTLHSPESIKENFKLAKSLEEILSNPVQSEELRIKINDERMELLTKLWNQLINIKVRVSKLKGY